MQISRLFLLAVLFAVPAVAQDKLYPPIKIYVQASVPGIPDGWFISVIKADCGNCVQTINRGSADFVLDIEQVPISDRDKWFWTIYDREGTAVFQASEPDSLKGTLRSVSLRFYEYSESLAEILSKPKAKASKSGTSKITKKPTQRTI
jgi:hypothetical protein